MQTSWLVRHKRHDDASHIIAAPVRCSKLIISSAPRFHSANSNILQYLPFALHQMERTTTGHRYAVVLACETIFMKPIFTGAKVGLCELPFALIQTDKEGGTGGTCVLRGCVPKKLLHYIAGFVESWEDAEGSGYAALTRFAKDLATMLLLGPQISVCAHN